MHKKTALATGLALAGLVGSFSGAAYAQSKVELWGVVDAAVRHTNNEGADRKGLTKMVGGGMSQSRWGLNIEEDLGGGSKALVHLEHRFNADNGEKDATAPFFQLSYVGLQGPYGRLTMGRQWNVLFDVVTSTYSSFPYSPYMDAYKPELGMAAGARSSNALKYTLATPDRTWVGTLQYAFDEGNKNTAAVENTLVGLAPSVVAGATGGAFTPTAATPLAILNGISPALVPGIQNAVRYPAANSPLTPLVAPLVAPIAQGALKNFGGFLRYSKNGISLGGGYLRTYMPAGTKLDAWTLGGSYRSGKLYVNAGYGLNKIKDDVFNGTTVGDLARYEARRLVDRTVINAFWQGQTNGGFQAGDANKRQMFKVGFGYQVTPQINAGVHYYYAKQSGSATGAFNGNAKFLVGVANYAFSKRTDAYVAVDHTTVSGGSRMAMDVNGARKRTGFTVGVRHRF